MQYDDLLKRAVEVRDMYDQVNAKNNRGQWNEADFMAGFVGDVGDLSKIVMAKRGLRKLDDVDAKLAHELSDCLWSVLILADKYGIDLPTEFAKTMDGLKKQLETEV